VIYVRRAADIVMAERDIRIACPSPAQRSSSAGVGSAQPRLAKRRRYARSPRKRQPRAAGVHRQRIQQSAALVLMLLLQMIYLPSRHAFPPFLPRCAFMCRSTRLLARSRVEGRRRVRRQVRRLLPSARSCCERRRQVRAARYVCRSPVLARRSAAEEGGREKRGGGKVWRTACSRTILIAAGFARR